MTDPTPQAETPETGWQWTCSCRATFRAAIDQPIEPLLALVDAHRRQHARTPYRP